MKDEQQETVVDDGEKVAPESEAAEERDAAVDFSNEWDQSGDDDAPPSEDDPAIAEADTLLEQSKAEEEAAAADAEATERYFTRIEAIHPDWRDMQADPRLIPWLEKQPQDIIAAATDTEDPDKGIKVLTLFKNAIASGDLEEPAPAETPEIEINDVDLGAFLDSTKLRDRPITDRNGKATTIGELLDGELGSDMSGALLTAMQAQIHQSRAGEQERIDAAVDRTLKNAGYASAADMAAMAEQLVAAQVMATHPDYPKVVASDAFKDYLEKAEPPLKKLWESNKFEERSAFLTQFKRSKVVSTADAAKRAKSEQLRKKSALHAGTLRSGAADERPGKANDDALTDEEKYAQEWNETD